ncbi:MAG: 6-bladed beta-propeller [Acidobacteriota bacterium]|nr:6-bladed beta-propeller [Acidobacteriota bacterium]
MKKTLIILLSPLMIAGPFVFGQDIRLIDKIPVSQQDCLIEADDGIAVLPNGSFIICDTRAGNFKIFDKNGRFVKIFGRRGNGPDEFSVPKLLDYANSRLLINDWGNNRVLIYQINDNLELKKVDVFLGICFDAKIFTHGYLLAGSKLDNKGRWHLLYLEYPDNGEYSFLLTCDEIFGLPQIDPVLSNLNGLKERVVIGGRAYCDFFNDIIFAVWEGDLNIIRIDFHTMNKSRFGKKTALYKYPEVTNELIRTRKEQKLNEYLRELQKFSMIRKIFATRKYIGVVYMNYNKNMDMMNPVVQLYSTDGEYLTEHLLEGASYPQHLMPFYFDKENNILNVLSMTIDAHFEPHYTLLKYRID